MNAFVCGENASTGEWLLADVTDEGPFLRVHPPVPSQVALLSERLPAQLALEGTDARVAALVHPKVRRHRKRLSALVALKGSFTSVHSGVFDECRLPTERLPTNSAGEQFTPTVFLLHMPYNASSVTEAFPTLLAPVSVLRRMSRFLVATEVTTVREHFPTYWTRVQTLLPCWLPSIRFWHTFIPFIFSIGISFIPQGFL